MKIIAIIILLFISLIATANDQKNVLDSIKKSLSVWQPLSVAMKKGNVIVVLNEQIITNKIYKAIILYGIFIPLWLGEKNSLNGVKSITILNKSKYQGYNFKGSKSLCEEIRKLEIYEKESEVYLMDRTEIYSK